MNKKVIALAVAGALAGPAAAWAQTSTVQIGGSLTMFYYKHSPHNSTTGQSGDVLESSEPEIFVRGEEQLGGGLSAWFQCTSSLDGIATGANAIANSGWCARNSGVGLKGSWGNLFMGNWDQPQKLVFNRARGWFGGTNAFTGGSAVLLNNGSASGTQNPVTSTAAFLSAGGVGISTTTSNNPGTFFRRQASSWNYHSPSWSGFSFQGAFSAANESTGNPEASMLDPRMWSVAGHYDNGPLYLGIAYERHNDYNPGNVAIGAGASAYGGGNDTNWTFVAGYTFAGKLNVRGLYSRSKYDATNSSDLDVKGWGVFADWNIAGPHTIRGQYVRVGDTGGTAGVPIGSYKGPSASTCGLSGPAGVTSTTSCASDTGAKLWAFFYSYAFSKRTMGSIGYSRMDNDSNANFSKGKTNATAGAAQSNFGLVMQHRF